jgi:plastocyanin
MRRGAGAAVCLALLGAAVALLPAAGLGTAGARADTAECGWHRHSKRVVKHVRRHGKRHRVVRWRHWWSCDPVAGAPSEAPSQTPPPTSEPEPVTNRLGVRASEYYFILSRPTVSSGEVTVELNNQGEDAHDLSLQREGSGEEPLLEVEETQSLQHTVAEFDLPAGTYRLWCSLPTHREKGMETTLVVDD